MPVETLKDFLDSQAVRYITTQHSPAYTAQELAHVIHTCGRQVAKTVILELDGKLAMVVMPATYRIRWDKFMRTMGTDFVELADEDDFEDHFSGCEVGAMPPFGNLFGMNVYLSETLAANEEIIFPAGSHSEIIRMSVQDYLRLVRPVLLSEGLVDPNRSPAMIRQCLGREPQLPEVSWRRSAC